MNIINLEHKLFKSIIIYSVGLLDLIIAQTVVKKTVSLFDITAI